MDAIAEITFMGMPKRKPAPSAPITPGWKALSEGMAEVVENCGLSVQAIATRAGLSRQYVYEMISGKCNPTIAQIESVFKAADMPLDRWLTDRALYGRDKPLHDKVQSILDNKGQRAVALRVIVGDED